MMLKQEHSADHNSIPYESPLTETTTSPWPHPHFFRIGDALDSLWVIVLDSDCSNFQPQASPAGKAGWERCWPLLHEMLGTGSKSAATKEVP